jgi:hypothetical protein
MMTQMAAITRAYARGPYYQLFRKDIQIGGGWEGGVTCPTNVSFTVGNKGRLPITSNKIVVGNKAAAKFKHLRSHVKEALLSPSGQHGIFALYGIDISIDVVDMPAPPVTGAMLIETAISAARSARRPVIIELSGDVRLQVNLHPRACDRGTSIDKKVKR